MIIDFHTHIGARRGANHAIAHHRAYGGGKSVILPIEPGDCTALGSNTGLRTELVIEAVEQYGDELLPFCHVNPLAPDALDQIRRYHASGKFYGFGEHKVRLACDHPVSLDIYRLCGELGWPVLIHFEYRNYSYNFEAFERVLQTFPDTIFVGHAQAWWANVSAEAPRDYTAPDYTPYPKDPVVLGGLTDRWLAEYPNIYGDLSAGSGLGALTRDPAFGKDFVLRHRSKLLWATDCPCRDGQGTLSGGRTRECFAGFTLPVLQEYCQSDEHYADITHRNAEQLLGL